MTFLVSLILFATGVTKLTCAAAQQRPTFAEYPVDRIYTGRPTPPVLHGDQLLFRTRIRQGAQHAVEFAGHYTLPRWGCGAGCNAFAIVDSMTGKVYDGPFSVVELPLPWSETHHLPELERMEFRPDSRLLKINACPNEHDCGFYDFVMVDGKGLQLIHKELLPKEWQ